MGSIASKKIFFVTSSDLPFFPGRGGTEAFTFGLIRELRRRDIDARLVTVGLQQKDGRAIVPDIPFVDVQTESYLSNLDATLISVCKPFIVPTKKPAFCMVHVPPSSTTYPLTRFKTALRRHKLVANSQFTRNAWAKALGLEPSAIVVLYPFADPVFAKVKRTPTKNKTRVLFAGRLHINKGIYLFLEALHHPVLQKKYQFSAMHVLDRSADSRLIANLLRQHPLIQLIPAAASAKEVAAVMANQDIVVVPSNHFFWQEAFGMVSVEAQHAGCRVVASNAGGLPETDLGSLHLFEPQNSQALANAIELARLAGPVSATARRQVALHYTVRQTADNLLTIIGQG